MQGKTVNLISPDIGQTRIGQFDGFDRRRESMFVIRQTNLFTFDFEQHLSRLRDVDLAPCQEVNRRFPGLYGLQGESIFYLQRFFAEFVGAYPFFDLGFGRIGGSL